MSDLLDAADDLDRLEELEPKPGRVGLANRLRHLGVTLLDYTLIEDLETNSPTGIREALIIHPGDYVAIITKDPLTDQAAHDMRRMFEATWPDVRVALIAGLDAEIVVLSPTDPRLLQPGLPGDPPPPSGIDVAPEASIPDDAPSAALVPSEGTPETRLPGSVRESYRDIPRGSVIEVVRPGGSTPRYYETPDFLGVFQWIRADVDSPWEPSTHAQVWQRAAPTPDAISIEPPPAYVQPDVPW